MPHFRSLDEGPTKSSNIFVKITQVELDAKIRTRHFHFRGYMGIYKSVFVSEKPVAAGGKHLGSKSLER